MSEYERMYETYRQQKNENKARQLRHEAIMQSRIEQLERELAECRRADVNQQLLEALKNLLMATTLHVFGDECLAERNAAIAAIKAAEGKNG